MDPSRFFVGFQMVIHRRRITRLGLFATRRGMDGSASVSTSAAKSNVNNAASILSDLADSIKVMKVKGLLQTQQAQDLESFQKEIETFAQANMPTMTPPSLQTSKTRQISALDLFKSATVANTSGDASKPSIGAVAGATGQVSTTIPVKSSLQLSGPKSGVIEVGSGGSVASTAVASGLPTAKAAVPSSVRLQDSKSTPQAAPNHEAAKAISSKRPSSTSARVGTGASSSIVGGQGQGPSQHQGPPAGRPHSGGPRKYEVNYLRKLGFAICSQLKPEDCPPELR